MATVYNTSETDWLTVGTVGAYTYKTDSTESSFGDYFSNKYLYQPFTKKVELNMKTDLNSYINHFNNDRITTGGIYTALTDPNNIYANCTASNTTHTWVTDSCYNALTNTAEFTLNVVSGTNNYLTLPEDGYVHVELGPNGFNVTPEKRLRIRRNLAVNVRKRGVTMIDLPANEMVAVETLREQISETDFRKFMRYGFINVRGESGDIYQIPRVGHVKVWRDGKLIEEICIHLRSEHKCPLTDDVLAFKTMIEADEEEFKKCGNRYRRAA